MKNKIQLLLVISISLLIGYFFGVHKVSYEWQNYQPHVSVINKEPPSTFQTVDMTQFYTVWDKLNTLYYDKSVLDQQKMLNGAISGLVSSLGDPFTLYLPPVQNTNFQQQLAGEFQGIGAELGLNGSNQIIVITPLEGSPAQKAGIKTGDIIFKVDNVITTGWTLQQTVDKIRGPKGTKVVLGVVHKGDKTLSSITITRDAITIKSVDGWVKAIKDIDAISDSLKAQNPDQKIMYLRLSQFGDNTNQDWTNLVASLNSQMQKQGNVKGIILDLRYNPGGYFTDAVFVASEFLKEGTPIVTQDSGGGDTNTLSVTRQGTLLNIPLVVLINGGSASASEIVAGALQDYQRAKLVGTTSFGKGTMQEQVDLGKGAGLHVTIAKWLTPKGRWIHQKGLTPDVSVDLNPKDPSHDTQLEKAIDVLLK